VQQQTFVVNVFLCAADGMLLTYGRNSWACSQKYIISGLQLVKCLVSLYINWEETLIFFMFSKGGSVVSKNSRAPDVNLLFFARRYHVNLDLTVWDEKTFGKNVILGHFAFMLQFIVKVN